MKKSDFIDGIPHLVWIASMPLLSSLANQSLWGLFSWGPETFSPESSDTGLIY